MFAEILTIGDELCRGEIVNTNASWLAAQLWDLDITVRWMTSCRDDVADMIAALTTAASRADLVITSGGLGPTEDDLTVDVLSQLVGAPPVFDAAAEATMVARFGSRSPAVTLTELMRRQVRVPGGARVHANPVGLAPGFEVTLGQAAVLALPGFPREIHGIFSHGLTARIAELRTHHGAAPAIARRIYRVFGRGESQIAEVTQGIVEAYPGASIHFQVKFPETLVKIVVRNASPDGKAHAEAALAAIDQALTPRLGEYCYGVGERRLPELAASELAAAGISVAVAESCTGGLLGALLTDAAGASSFFRGGIIAYANDEKVRQLEVSERTLDEHGAVSEECVTEMALGAQRRFEVDRAVSISGIAGPDGGTDDKPVGTVWLAVASRNGDVVTKRIRWPGSRDMVRTLAAWWALTLLRQSLPKDPTS